MAVRMSGLTPSREFLEGLHEEIAQIQIANQNCRIDLKGLGRDRIRHCLAMVGITTDRSCSIGLGRMVGRINGSDESEQLLSRQRRELNLGLLLGGDQDGRIYRAAVAVAERWCQPEALCDGGPSVNSDQCPLCISRSCAVADRNRERLKAG